LWPTRLAGSDLNARILAEPLGSVLKQAIVVQNKPGIGGALGTAYVVKAKPDGYTLAMSLSSVVVHPEAERISSRKPQYELNQLEPVS
jgi:tripartite-type tricarboxylate transporter receptor subunit TctC